jgi:hypothetical protein
MASSSFFILPRSFCKFFCSSCYLNYTLPSLLALVNNLPCAKKELCEKPFLWHIWAGEADMSVFKEEITLANAQDIGNAREGLIPQ